jgi:hypothetical protein
MRRAAASNLFTTVNREHSLISCSTSGFSWFGATTKCVPSTRTPSYSARVSSIGSEHSPSPHSQTYVSDDEVLSKPSLVRSIHSFCLRKRASFHASRSARLLIAPPTPVESSLAAGAAGRRAPADRLPQLAPPRVPRRSFDADRGGWSRLAERRTLGAALHGRQHEAVSGGYHGDVPDTGGSGRPEWT